MNPQYSRLYNPLKNETRLTSALETIKNGIKNGSIRNVDYKNAKDTISRAIESAWKRDVRTPVINKEIEEVPAEVRNFMNSVNMYGVSNVISTFKKLQKCKNTDPIIIEMRKFVEDLLPLVQDIVFLKDKIVKGREPKESKNILANPNKKVRTCPCCFRQIAVKNGKMVHHGYTRPAPYIQTSSCFGVRFEPWEASKEGTEYMVSIIEARLVNVIELYNNKESKKSLLYKNFNKKTEIIDSSSPRWDNVYKSYVWNLESEIKHCKHDIGMFKKKLETWKKVE